jgi:hypothetical protein
MRMLHTKGIVAVPMLLAALVLSNCMDLAEAILQLGQSVYGELKPPDDSPDAKELSDDLDTFIKQRRAGKR